MKAVYALVVLCLAATLRAQDPLCEDCLDDGVRKCWDHANKWGDSQIAYRETCASLKCEEDQLVLMIQSSSNLNHIRLKVDGAAPEDTKCRVDFDRATGWPRALLNFPSSLGPIVTGPVDLPVELEDESYWDLQQSYLYNARSDDVVVEPADVDEPQTTHPGAVLTLKHGDCNTATGSVDCPTQYTIQSANVLLTEYFRTTGRPDIEAVTRKMLILRCAAKITPPPPQNYLPVVKEECGQACRQTQYEISGAQSAQGNPGQYLITVKENKHVSNDEQVGWFVHKLTAGVDEIVNDGQSTLIGAEIDTMPARQAAWTPSINQYDWNTDDVVVPPVDSVLVQSTSHYCVHNAVAGAVVTAPLCSAL